MRRKKKIIDEDGSVHRNKIKKNSKIKRGKNKLKREIEKLKESKTTAWRRYFNLQKELERSRKQHNDTLNELKKIEKDSKIPTHIINQLKEFIKKEECPICLELINKEDFYVTHCGHYIHYYCICQSHSFKKNCPKCRRLIKNL